MPHRTTLPPKWSERSCIRAYLSTYGCWLLVAKNQRITNYRIRRLRLSRLLLEQAARHPSPRIIRTFGNNVKKHSRPVLIMVVFGTFFSGCAAIGARQGSNKTRPYAGVRDDIHYLAHPSEADVPSLQWLNVIDLPFSAVVDTVMLPFDSRSEPNAAQNAKLPNQSSDPTLSSGTSPAAQETRHP